MFLSMYQPATKNHKTKFLCFDFCCCLRNSKREQASLSLLFQIASTTKIKTKNFVCYSPAISTKETKKH